MIAKRWTSFGSRPWALLDDEGNQVGVRVSFTRGNGNVEHYIAYYFRTKRDALAAAAKQDPA